VKLIGWRQGLGIKLEFIEGPCKSNCTRKFRLGEFHSVFLYWFDDFRIWLLIMMLCLLFSLGFSSYFWNFPKTAWWRRVNCQATHVAEPISGYFFYEPPGGSARSANCFDQLFPFCLRFENLWYLGWIFIAHIWFAW